MPKKYFRESLINRERQKEKKSNWTQFSHSKLAAKRGFHYEHSPYIRTHHWHHHRERLKPQNSFTQMRPGSRLDKGTALFQLSVHVHVIDMSVPKLLKSQT